MHVVSSREMETRCGPGEWITGDIWMEAGSIPSPGAGFFRVIFDPGGSKNCH